MSVNTERTERIRVQLDLTPVEVSLLELLQARLAVRSRADMLQQAVGAFLWIVEEALSGRRIVSVDAPTLNDVARFKELSLPAIAPAAFTHYEYLAKRPGSGRVQPYLKGRNMTVGQLVYKMRANGLSPEEAAEDMDLPLLQVREAVAYYQVHRDEVDGEAAEEGRQLIAQGVELEPRPVP